jgi:hypothetical protein
MFHPRSARPEVADARPASSTCPTSHTPAAGMRTATASLRRTPSRPLLPRPHRLQQRCVAHNAGGLFRRHALAKLSPQHHPSHVRRRVQLAPHHPRRRLRHQPNAAGVEEPVIPELSATSGSVRSAGGPYAAGVRSFGNTSAGGGGGDGEWGNEVSESGAGRNTLSNPIASDAPIANQKFKIENEVSPTGTRPCPTRRRTPAPGSPRRRPSPPGAAPRWPCSPCSRRSSPTGT